MKNRTETQANLSGPTAKILRELRKLSKTTADDNLILVSKRIAHIQGMIQNLFSDDKKGG